MPKYSLKRVPNEQAKREKEDLKRRTAAENFSILTYNLPVDDYNEIPIKDLFKLTKPCLYFNPNTLHYSTKLNMLSPWIKRSFKQPYVFRSLNAYEFSLDKAGQFIYGHEGFKGIVETKNIRVPYIFTIPDQILFIYMNLTKDYINAHLMYDLMNIQSYIDFDNLWIKNFPFKKPTTANKLSKFIYEIKRLLKKAGLYMFSDTTDLSKVLKTVVEQDENADPFNNPDMYTGSKQAKRSKQFNQSKQDENIDPFKY